MVDRVMTYQPVPTKVEGGVRKTRSSDDATLQVLELILVELSKINTQLALMNDTVLNTGDSL